MSLNSPCGPGHDETTKETRKLSHKKLQSVNHKRKTQAVIFAIMRISCVGKKRESLRKSYIELMNMMSK